MVTILNAPLPEQSQQHETKFEEHISSININNLNFTYPNSNEGIKNINLTLPAKGLVAVVGASGSGKSTLFDCLLGFHPQVIEQISINNKPLDATSISTLQNAIAWIPQTPTLFYQSISDNIKIAKPAATQLELEQAAHQAGALDFIKTLENGFDTLIGEQGEGLSGGQKQRIALARAFLKQAPILVLDEPTAHLDSQTEQLIQQAINNYAKNHLVLVIAHRLSTVTNADKIIVLEKGQIKEMGTHDELIQKNGLYSNLYNIQFN